MTTDRSSAGEAMRTGGAQAHGTPDTGGDKDKGHGSGAPDHGTNPLGEPGENGDEGGPGEGPRDPDPVNPTNPQH